MPIARDGAMRADQAAALARLRDAAAKTDRIAIPAAGARRAAIDAVPQTVVIPLCVDGNQYQAVFIASDMRKALEIGTLAVSNGAVATHLIGQGALWAGLQEISRATCRRPRASAFRSSP